MIAPKDRGMTEAHIPVEAPLRRHSLQWRLPVLVCGLIVVVLAVVVYSAYREVEATLERGAGERAEQAAQQIAGMFAPSTAQTVAQLQRVVPAVRDYLMEPAPARLEGARAALAAVAPTATRHVTVWSATSERLFDVPGADGADDTAPAMPVPRRRPEPGIGPIRAEGDVAFADFATVVADDAGAPLGWISVRARLSVTPPDALHRLVGGDARILFGGPGGALWTDMTRVTDGPAVDLSSRQYQRFRIPRGEERIGALSDLPGTPWLVWVGFPRAAMVGTAHAFLWRMGATVLVVAIVAMLLARRLVADVTRPLTAMTTAAEAIAGGDYSRRVATDRRDEIGRLGRAFNAMSSDVARELAERKRAHEQLQERESQLRLYALDSPAAVAMFDGGMRFLVASRSWVEDYQLGDQPIVGRRLYDVLPDLPAQWREVHQRALAGAVEKSEEDPYHRADGTTSWLRWEVRPWRQGDGAIGGVIIFSEDITARNTAEAALRESEDRYRTLFDYAPDGILIATPDRRYIDVNPSMCRMLRRTREETIGLYATDIVAPVEHDRIDPTMQSIAARDEHQNEWQIQRGDGTVFAADVIATQMPDGNVLGMFRDITERNRAVEAVRAAEERMRFALQSAGVGIWDADYATGTVRWSGVLEAQFGLPPGAFEGPLESFFERIHPDDRDAVRATIAEARTGGTEFSMQHRIIRPDGAVRWVNGAGQIHLDAEGRAVRGVGVSFDVTERHILEAQFQQAQKMEAVGRLAGGVAHDFNNLLTAILGYCGLLLDDLRAEDPIRQDVIEIQKAGTRAAELTGQLLAFSRRQIIEPTLLDMNDVVNGLRSLLGRLINEDVQISTALSATPMLHHRRPRAGRADHRQPGGQCPRRHAQGGPAHHRDRPCGPRRRLRRGRTWG